MVAGCSPPPVCWRSYSIGECACAESGPVLELDLGIQEVELDIDTIGDNPGK